MAPILAHIDVTKPVIIETDTADVTPGYSGTEVEVKIS